MTPVYVLVQGMYMRADSIAYDATFQLRALRKRGIPAEVYVEEFDRENYPDVEAKPFGELADALRRAPGPVLYHWVDGWEEGDDLLLRSDVPIVLRWHNNTPPWFFAAYSEVPTRKTVRGFIELLRVADALPDARLWTNSEFSRRQLDILGIERDRVDIVYPASSYLESSPTMGDPRTNGHDGPIRLLFVGRVVPHKGHLHLLAAARAVAEMTGRDVRVSLPGRPDGDLERYDADIRLLAERLNVEIDVPGAVTNDELDAAYREADVFVGLSEHEGFGLPILEAMTRGIPVVGYRCSAVAELLRDHPLAVDELDPQTIARRIVAALDPVARRALATWQISEVLPRFAAPAIETQLDAAMARVDGLGAGSPASEIEATSDATSPAPSDVMTALARASELPGPELDLPYTLPRDLNPHFVTRYDLDAYRALLRARDQGRGKIRDRALHIEFESHRDGLGGIMARLKNGLLRMQDGLIRTIEMSHDDLDEKITDANERLESLSAEIKALRRIDQRRKRPPKD